MVSMFDRSIPRTPERDVRSVSAELPILVDTLFTPVRPEETESPDLVPPAHDDAVDLHDVLAFERDQTTAADLQSSPPVSHDAPAHDAPAHDAPAHDAPAHDAPAHDAPAHDAPAHDAPAHDAYTVEADHADAAGRSEARILTVDVAPDGANDAQQVAASPPDESVAGRDDNASDVTPVLPAERTDHTFESPGDVQSPAGQCVTADEADAAMDEFVPRFPAPSLDDQIDEAFAAPPIVQLGSGAHDATGGAGFDHHDSSATPPLGAAAFATPFPSASIGTPTPDFASPTRHTPHLGVQTTPSQTPNGIPALGRASASPVPREQEPPATDDDFVDLGSWLRDDQPVRSTRMVTAEATPTGDEQADFDEMLRRFKQGVAANVDEEDFASHYDLGVAYKEMGLVDEAIAEFQKSLRGDAHRVRSYEALGQCFVEKGQLLVAITLLQRAVETTGADDQQLVGVLYLLGYASEVMARHADALRYYQRVFAVDIEFRDVVQRVAAIEQITQ